MDRLLLLAALVFLYASGCLQPAPKSPVQSQPSLHPLAEAVDAIEKLDALRSTRAQTFIGDTPVTPETFAQVCKPVRERAMSIGKEHGWIVQQIAIKYRNPAHKPDPEALGYFPLFEQEPTLHNLTIWTTYNDQPGLRYFRRITVEKTCLACHGAKEQRPEFIQKAYPDDRAYNFKEGDLRGLYSVFIPTDSIPATVAPLLSRREP